MLTNVDEKTTLRDLHFKLNYALSCGTINPTEAGDMLIQGLNKVVTKANKTDALSDVDIHLLSFFQYLRSGKVTTRNGLFIRPVLKMLDERVEAATKMDVFFTYIETVEKAHAAWIYSNLPQYFIEHPLDGFETVYMKDFGEREITTPSFVIAEKQLLDNCFSAGYIKSPIEFRLHTPRGDTKLKQKVMDLFISYGLGISKPIKVALKNDLQEWSFVIPLKKIDQVHLESSEKINAKIKDLVEQHATGSAYFIYLEEEKLTTKGFKNQADIQTFLDAMKSFVICQNSGEPPTHLYLSGTLHLMSVQNRQGKTLPLTKFKI